MNQELTPEYISQLAAEFGTPLYIYHAETIGEQYAQLKKAFAATPTRFFYAAKALTNINILRYIKSIGCNVDCSSINEVMLALKAGFDKGSILYTSNNIAFSEIEQAKELGVYINIDSLSNLEKFGRKFGHTYPVAIRLRPNIMAGGNLKISTGHENSKFGIPLEQIEQVKKVVRETGLFIRGLHLHTGSDIKDVEVFARGIEVLFDVALHFPELDFIDLGGGFKVAYQEGDEVTNIELLGKKVTEEFNQFRERYGRPVETWFEPGKFLVSKAGFLVARVNVLKESANTVFAGIDTGLNHFIRPMFYGSYHILENISNPGGPVKNYTIVGNICETDTFADHRPMPEIREGDLILFRNTGAYGFEMASNYNSRFRPAEVLVKDGKAHLIRRREEMDDLLRNQVEVEGL